MKIGSDPHLLTPCRGGTIHVMFEPLDFITPVKLATRHKCVA